MNYAPRIAFVIPYYGRWPEYWPIWAESAAHNPQFDFLVVTDLEPACALSRNIRIVRMPYQEVLSRLSVAVGFTLPCASYHKLCDFRPFFGLAFSDLLELYDHWGYCDVDLIFGSLEPLLKAASTRTIDFISPWTCTIGHCCLLRNTESVNRVGLAIRDLKARALLSDTTFMDEGGLSETALNTGGFTFEVVQNIDVEWRKPQCFLGATARPDGRLAGLTGLFILHYSNGRVHIYDRNHECHEVLYFHFMGMKARRFWRDLARCDLNRFSFTPYGLVRGLLDPAQLHSIDFKSHCFAAQLPGFLYRSMRALIPQPGIDKAKELRWNRRRLQTPARSGALFENAPRHDSLS